MHVQPKDANSSPHTERIVVLNKELPSVGKELNEVFLGEPMGNRESKEAAAHAARLVQEAETTPVAVKADLEEKHNKASVKVQGGRWLEKDAMPLDASSQKKQPDVIEAVKASHQPEAEEKEALREKARHQATGGRW